MAGVAFPYLTDYVNDVFARERKQWDFILLRPVLLVLYFFLRCVLFPFKFVFHRRSYGFEARTIDWFLALGMKYLATPEAASLFVRHLQIEPLLYRYILMPQNGGESPKGTRLNGIDGDYNIDSIRTVIRNNTTLGHDQLSYEVMDRFDKDCFVAHLSWLRQQQPGDHQAYSKAVLDENRRHSFAVLGPTNVVLLTVMTITIFGDLRATVQALNSFASDSVLLWCLKHLYAHDAEALIQLDFFMQEMSNRGHYNASAFFSNPHQYLYYHIVFHEVAHELLTTHPPAETRTE